MNDGRVEELIGQLKLRGNGQRVTRLRAINALGECGDRRAVGPLIELLGDENELMSLRGSAAKALGDIGDSSAIPALGKALGRTKKYAQLCIIEALGKLGDSELAVLAGALRHGDREIRRYAAQALGEEGSEFAAPLLAGALGDRDEDVRQNAVEGLVKIGGPAVPALNGALADEDDAVRLNAVAALGMIGSPAVPALVEALGDKNGTVRLEAVGALGEIGDVSAVPALIGTLGDGDADVREYAAQALGKFELVSRHDLNLLRIAAREARVEGRPTGEFAKVYREWSGILNERAKEKAEVKKMRAPSRPGKPDGRKRISQSMGILG